MGKKFSRSFWALITAAMILVGLVLAVAAQSAYRAYLPASIYGGSQMQEVRALWVTRFDWTTPGGSDPAKIDEIVANASLAGFNVIYFQIRGEADAYYASAIEPWSSRVSGTLGQDPGWDPLQRMIDRAHDASIQVHAYLNVYPLWTGCDAPDENVTPRHLYYKLVDVHGTTGSSLNGVQWTQAGQQVCDPYMRVTPASNAFDEHLEAVVADLVTHYDLDGIHLDHIRYDGRSTSCDPVSAAQFGNDCFSDDGYSDWQREQVNKTVKRLFDKMIGLNPDLWLSAAVWPIYRDTHGWNASSGYIDYYQDPKAWLSGAYIDGVSPMIYTGSPDCSRPYFWTRERWNIPVADYQTARNGRAVVPGIGVNFCTPDDFAEIEARIQLARAAGTAGHVIFSYSGLLAKHYFDDLAAGPYAVPADVPPLTWH